MGPGLAKPSFLRPYTVNSRSASLHLRAGRTGRFLRSGPRPLVGRDTIIAGKRRQSTLAPSLRLVVLNSRCEAA